MIIRRAWWLLALALLLAASLPGCENVSRGGPSAAPGAAEAMPVTERCEPAPLAAPAELSSKPGYAEIAATVTDSNGGYVHGLGKDDFVVTVDGAQQKIEFFQPESNPPASVGILVDTSGSMEAKIPQARTAIAEFVGSLNKSDDVLLIAFSTRPFLLQPLTTNHDLVLQRLALLHAYGQTALFDTIAQSITLIGRGCYQKKVLLVLTDGMDNSSQATAEDVAAQANRSGVLIYSVGIGNPNAAVAATTPIGPLVLGAANVERVDARTLDKLARETGSRTFIIRQVADGDALRGAYKTIADDLRAQYTLGFIAPAATTGTPEGKLAVQLRDRPGLTVRTRETVPLPAATASTAQPAASASP